MLGRRCLLGAVLAAGVAGAAPASAGDCPPARLGDDAAELPRAWRQALEALVAATAHEGQPWSCPDARVTLVPPGDRSLAQLEVEDAGGVRRRPVASPADVVPLGEAMLARTFVLEGATNPPPANPPPPPTMEQALPLRFRDGGFAPLAPGHDGGSAPNPPGHGPELLVDFLVGSRFTGPTKAMLMGAELRTALLFDRWSAGLMARYDTAIAYLQPVPDQFSLASVSVGLAGGFRLLAAPVELTLAVEPSLAVLLMSSQQPGMEPDADTKVDLRLGGRFSAAIPIKERIRAVCALGGEGAPDALFSDRHSRRHELPPLPSYLAGLSVGIELVAIR